MWHIQICVSIFNILTAQFLAPTPSPAPRCRRCKQRCSSLFLGGSHFEVAARGVFDRCSWGTWGSWCAVQFTSILYIYLLIYIYIYIYTPSIIINYIYNYIINSLCRYVKFVDFTDPWSTYMGSTLALYFMHAVWHLPLLCRRKGNGQTLATPVFGAGSE